MLALFLCALVPQTSALALAFCPLLALPTSRECTVLDRACQSQSTVNSHEVNSKSTKELRRDALQIEYTLLSASGFPQLSLWRTMLRMPVHDNPSIHLMRPMSAPPRLTLTQDAITVAAMPRQRLIFLLVTTPVPRRGRQNNTLLYQTLGLTLQYKQSPSRHYRNVVRLRTRTSTSARVIVALARVQAFDYCICLIALCEKYALTPWLELSSVQYND